MLRVTQPYILVLCLLMGFAVSTRASDGDARVVADLIPDAASTRVSAEPQPLLAIDDTVYFSTRLGLWRLDADADAPSFVRALPRQPVGPAVRIGRQFFFVSDGRGLWRSDGTTEGTRQLTDSADSASLVDARGRLWFQGRLSGRYLLFTTDGTMAGTRAVAEVPGRGQDFAAFGEGVLFVVNDQLFVCDGPQGNVRPIPGTPKPRGAAVELRRRGVALFATFGADSAIWITDGTPEGTEPFFDVRGGALTAFGSRIIFLGFDEATGSEPWITDGTRLKTFRLADLAPGEGNSSPYDFTATAGRVFFTATTPAAGRELWVTDGRPGGTRLVEDLMPGPGSSNLSLFGTSGRSLIFTRGDRPWISDGTSAGTRPVAGAPAATELIGARGLVAFVAKAGDLGAQLWTANLPKGSAERRTELVVGQRGEWYGELTSLGSDLYFAARNDLDERRLLWRVDEAGAVVQIRDEVTGFIPRDPLSLQRLGERLVFMASNGRPELFATQPGSTESEGPGAGRLDQLTENFSAAAAPRFHLYRDRLYFTGAAHPFRDAVWSTDGTAAGTSLFLDPVDEVAISSYVNVGDQLYFVAGTAWQSDGTSEGTSILLSTLEASSVGERSGRGARPIRGSDSICGTRR